MNIDTSFFDGKTVLVFGLGSNGGGAGTVEFLLSTGVKKIIITDQKDETTLGDAIAPFQDIDRISFRLGEHFEADFVEADIVIKNPGIKWDHPLLEKAKEHGASIMMDSTIFAALCSAPILGITGSKGKTTTASALAHILKVAGYNVVQAGVSQVGVLSELSKITEDSVVVFELSSWRLAGLQSLQKSPHISIITNLYPDHLNYYGGMEEYAKDKRIITEFQTEHDVLILPKDNEWTPFFIEGTKARIETFGCENTLSAWQDDRALYLREENEDVEILQKEKSLFQGDHIFNNFLAASLAAKNFGVSIQSISEALKTFPGVPHRFELVREQGGVKYINDTAATIPAASLSSLRSVNNPVILLAGGSDKGLPLEDLLIAIKESKKAILFDGNGTEKIVTTLKEQGIENFQVVKSMKEAVAEANLAAEVGDVVLLAPGAASFGMFQNEFDRGDQFVEEVNNL